MADAAAAGVNEGGLALGGVDHDGLGLAHVEEDQLGPGGVLGGRGGGAECLEREDQEAAHVLQSTGTAPGSASWRA